MPKRFHPNTLHDALRGEYFPRQLSSRQSARIMDRVLAANPRLSGREQSIAEIEIRDEMARRRSNRLRLPF